MRVGVDGRSLAGSPARGVAQYTSALVAALAHAYPADEWRVLVPAGPSTWPGHDHGPPSGVAVQRHPLPGRALHGAAALTGRPRLDLLLGGRLDVLWAPAPAPLALSGRQPLALTVHDLSFERRPRDFTSYERAWHRLARPRELARRAARVLAVSQATRAEAIERWELDPRRVVVVEPGLGRPGRPCDAAAVDAARRRHGLSPGYLLYVGALEPRKAPDVLARAYARARTRGLDAELAMVGAGRLAGRLAGPGVRLLGRVADRELDALYEGALALVAPSWLEGFGLTPLEAVARGVPAVVSDLPPFAETLGDGALRVPAGDEAALADALLRVAADAGLRSRLVTAGRQASDALSWERAARRARAALAEAATEGARA